MLGSLKTIVMDGVPLWIKRKLAPLGMFQSLHSTLPILYRWELVEVYLPMMKDWQRGYECTAIGDVKLIRRHRTNIDNFRETIIPDLSTKKSATTSKS